MSYKKNITNVQWTFRDCLETFNYKECIKFIEMTSFSATYPDLGVNYSIEHEVSLVDFIHCASSKPAQDALRNTIIVLMLPLTHALLQEILLYAISPKITVVINDKFINEFRTKLASWSAGGIETQDPSVSGPPIL